MVVDGKKFTFNITVDIQIDPIVVEESTTNWENEHIWDRKLWIYKHL